MGVVRIFVSVFAALLCFIAAPATAQPVEYLVDDGSAENSLGLSSGGDIWWANAFTVQPGAETISTIRIAFSSSNLGAGAPFSVHVYEDPDDDGNPSTGPLQLLASASAAVTDPNGASFQDIAIGPATVSGGFFVAAVMTHPGGSYPAAFDQSASAASSWLAGAGAAVIDPADPFASLAIGPGLIDSFGFPGNFLLRAVAGRQEIEAIPALGPSGAALLVCVLGLAGVLVLRRLA
jgi:hypothetical protein